MPPESHGSRVSSDPPALAAPCPTTTPEPVPLLLTDYAPAGGFVVEPEDVWSCSEPDAQGRVRAVVLVGGSLLRVEGRRIFHV